MLLTYQASCIFIPVDDNLVDTDKIGTSVYFWSVSRRLRYTCESFLNPEVACNDLESLSQFPSKATQNRKRAIADVEEKTEEARKRIKKAQEDMVREKDGREETEERQAVSAPFSSLSDRIGTRVVIKCT